MAAINRSSDRLVARILEQQPQDIVTSVICAAELRYGAKRSSKREEALARLQLFLSSIRPMAFDVPALDAYGRIRAELARKGKPIGPLDTLIAAHAVSLDLTLITNNTREFRRVAGLRIEDWL